MKFDKSLKILWFVNGILILVLVSIALVTLIDEMIPRNYGNDDIIVGQRLENAKEDGLALQGLAYSTPESIYNSTNMFMTVSPETYDDPRQVLGVLDLGLSSGNLSTGFYGIMNLIFLNDDYNVLRTLLDKTASISSFEFAQANRSLYKHPEMDSSVKYIAYEIGYEDTNNDDYLNSIDHHDLYISDLDGQNLTQITDQLNILDFNFQNANSELFIRFKERTGEPEEHIRERYAIYDIASKNLRFLTNLDETLDKLEKTLIN